MTVILDGKKLRDKLAKSTIDSFGDFVDEKNKIERSIMELSLTIERKKSEVLSLEQDLLNYRLSFEKNKQKYEEQLKSKSINEMSARAIAVYTLLEDKLIRQQSQLLQEEFKKRGMDVVVEDRSATDVLDANGWKYARSYDATRTFLESVILEYPTLEYFVDLHRDSVSRSISTVTIGDTNYAKVMFLIGMENAGHAANEALTIQIEEYLNSHYEGISRGIYRKSGTGVNGVYNQDFSPNVILIEIGGMENTLEEVYHTCLAIAEALYAVMVGDA